jgi:hypothetical protein
MATIQRPLKLYNTRKYVDEVAADPDHLAPILAAEVDADIDTIYDAWNTGVDGVNIRPGSVTTDKLADGSVTDPKIVSVAYSKVTGAPAIPVSLPPSGPAGGDLAGTYPAPIIRAKSINGRDKIIDNTIDNAQITVSTIQTDRLGIDAATQFGHQVGPSVAVPFYFLPQAGEVVVSVITAASPASRGGIIILIGQASGYFYCGGPGVGGIAGRLRSGGSYSGPDGTMVGLAHCLGQSGLNALPFSVSLLGLHRGGAGGTGPFKVTVDLTGDAASAYLYEASMMAFELA